MMTKKERTAWQNGYLIACCNLANLHRTPEVASDVLAEAGITKAELARMDLTEYDLRALADIRDARSKDPICN
jgi:hypothetical protein